ncbi:MAG: hypothetical protein LBK13_10935 [Spirochaetales bacterium]|jgi:hypothetical protein|nr:hypothetical protein [Spirochaetales bacterium]
MKKLLPLIAVFFFLVFRVGAQTILNEEFWADLEGGPVFDGTVPPEKDTDAEREALRRILEEGRYVFSGMIFGFTFSYTPLDRGRNIQEEFTLNPVYEIAWGDPGLFVHQTRREGRRIYARLRYRLHGFQENWYEGNLSNLMGSAAGLGDAPIFAGWQEKMNAIRDSVRSAVREYARGRIDNKPLKVTGTAFLNGAPRIEILQGAFHARSALRLKIDTVVSYGAY